MILHRLTFTSIHIVFIATIFALNSLNSNTNKTFIGKSASPISLLKISDNKYFRTKNILGDKNIVISFLVHGVDRAEKKFQNFRKYMTI